MARSLRKRFVGVIYIALFLICFGANAQTPTDLGNLNPAILQGLARQNGAGQDVPSPLDDKGVVPEGGAARTERAASAIRPATQPEVVSRLEQDYSQRFIQAIPRDRLSGAVAAPLRQFGYDMLRNRDLSGATPLGASSDNYPLGIGDEIVISLRGQHPATYRTRVDRDGRLILPDLEPVAAAGRTFGAVRDELTENAEQVFVQTKAFVSLGAVRAISVYVLGEVDQPGLHHLNGLSNLIDALTAAGGPRKSGTLRNIIITHGNRQTSIDLYDLLVSGHFNYDTPLADGDRIFVGPLGTTVAVAGEVRRAGIYELKPSQSVTPGRLALGLAGGGLRSVDYLVMKVGRSVGGHDAATTNNTVDQVALGDGDILLMLQNWGDVMGGFALDGAVSIPGVRSLAAEPSVAKMLANSGVLKEDAYLLFGVLVTTDEQTHARRLIPVDLTKIKDGGGDIALKQNDRLIVLGTDDIRYLNSSDVQDIIGGGKIALRAAVTGQTNTGQTNTGQTNARRSATDIGADELSAGARTCAGLRKLGSVIDATRRDRFSNAFQAVTPDGVGKTLPNVMACPPLFDTYPDLLAFVLDYTAVVQGEVTSPGPYPVLQGTPIPKVLAVAGGLAQGADASKVEVRRFDSTTEGRAVYDLNAKQTAQVPIQPGDLIRVTAVFSNRDAGPIVLRGEFRYPGVYNIFRGEKLSEAITRAGGLTEQAYPIGSVMMRVRLREQEQLNNDLSARRFEASLSSSLSRLQGAQETTMAQLSVLQGMVQDIRSTPALGRAVIEADPSVLQVRPDLDVVMEPGDEVFMPKRPNHVSIAGEVLVPGAQQFNPELGPVDYIREAGGVTQAADIGRAFLVLPNGQAKPLAVSSWNFTSVHIPPGSTIIVPRDARPFDVWEFSKDLFSTASSVAITAASLAVISR